MSDAVVYDVTARVRPTEATPPTPPADAAAVVRGAARNAALVRDYREWLEHSRKVSPRTVYNYTAVLARFLAHIGGVYLGDVPLAMIQAWVERPRRGRAHGQGGSAATLAKEIIVVRGLDAYLLARGVLTDDPTALLVAPKVHNHDPNPVPDDVWVQLWTATPLNDEQRVVLGLGYFRGLRREEICRLSPHHFVLADGRLVDFRRKGGHDGVTKYGEMLEVVARKLPHVVGPDRPDSFLSPLERVVEARGRGARRQVSLLTGRSVRSL